MKAPRAALLPESLCAALALACFWLGGALPIWNQGPTREFVPGPRSEGSLRVVTWNLGGSVATNAKRGGNPFQDEHLVGVAATLKAIDADIVVLQELKGEGQLQELATRLAPGSHWFMARGHSRPMGIVAIGWKLDEGSHSEGQQSLRCGSVLALRHSSGIRLALAGLHASPWNAERRNSGIGEALTALLGTSADGHILCGDLNMDVDPGARRDLFSDKAHLDVQTYGFLADSLEDAGVQAGATAEPDRRLDYVFFDQDTLALRACAPWRGQRQGAMDHHPLVADFEFKP